MGQGRVLINRDCSAIAGAAKPCAIARDAQAIFCRRRHQPRRPPLAKIRPGSPARRWDQETVSGSEVARPDIGRRASTIQGIENHFIGAGRARNETLQINPAADGTHRKRSLIVVLFGSRISSCPLNDSEGRVKITTF